MGIFDKMLASGMKKKAVRKPSLLANVIGKPEDFKLEAAIEGEEIVVKIKKKELMEHEDVSAPKIQHEEQLEEPPKTYWETHREKIKSTAKMIIVLGGIVGVASIPCIVVSKLCDTILHR